MKHAQVIIKDQGINIIPKLCETIEYIKSVPSEIHKASALVIPQNNQFILNCIILDKITVKIHV